MSCEEDKTAGATSVKTPTNTGHAVTTVSTEHVSKADAPKDAAELQLENQNLRKEVESLKAELQGIRKEPISEFLRKINHYSRIVVDAEVSKKFYTEILGCTILNRPNFGVPGYWLWMGNIQLHLIQGTHPPGAREGAPVGQVNHISFECFDIEKVEGHLKSNNVSYKKNLVPEGKYLLTQLFFPDPDGYYIEVCTCDLMNEFVFAPMRPAAEDKSFTGYQEGIDPAGATLALFSGLNWSVDSSAGSEAEFNGMLESFKKSFDIVCGGAKEVSPQGLSTLLTKMGNVVKEDELEGLFKSLDIDGSGSISFREVLKILVKTRGSKEEALSKLKEAFKAQDTDNSGFISLEEASAVVWGLGLNIDKEQIAERFSEMDKSGNGRVSFEEFAEDFAGMLNALASST